MKSIPPPAEATDNVDKDKSAAESALQEEKTKQRRLEEELNETRHFNEKLSAEMLNVRELLETLQKVHIVIIIIKLFCVLSVLY